MEVLHNSILFRILVVSFIVIFFVTMAPVVLADFTPSGKWYVQLSSTPSSYDGLRDTRLFWTDSTSPVYLAASPKSTGVNIFPVSPGRLSIGKYVYSSDLDGGNVKSCLLDDWGDVASSNTTSQIAAVAYGVSSFFTSESLFTSHDAIVTYFSDFNPPVQASAGSFDLPCGNVAYIKVSGTEPVWISGTFQQYSNLSGSWSNMTVLYTSGVSLPSGSVSFPLSGMSPVPFSVSGGTNIFGQSQTGSAAIRGSNYICIYNPTWQQYGQGNNHDMNPTLSISHPAIQEIKIYPLSGSIVTGTGIVSGSDSSYDDYFDGTVDSETGEVVFTDQNGELANPVTGGTGYVPPDLNGQGLGAAIQQILQDIVNALNNVFSITHNAIAQLVASGRNFMASLSGLYSWLPPAVFGVLSSAVILVITIGILKVFL